MSSLVVSHAVDNNYSQSFPSCSHTAKNRNVAWLQLNLGKIYSLKSVKIYTRNEANWPPYRFRQFYLDVSNSSAQNSTQRVRCYTDNSTLATPSPVIDIPCKQTARYVIVETKYKAPEDTDSTGPILEICEIEVIDIQCSITCTRGLCDDSGLCVQGCISGYWGSNCMNRCPVNCFDNNCHNNGSCIGCSSGSYGDYCTKKCNNRCNSKVCNQNTGDCADTCVVGYYGSKCESPCSTNCSSESCRKDDGACLNGCKNSFFGSRCEHLCNQQCTNTSCDVFSGHCVGGCNEGFYGAFCNLTCSSTCATSKCNQLDGVCNDGCLPHWSGKTCEANQQLFENNTKTEVYSALYVVVAILLISIFLNIFLIVRNARKNINKRQKTEHLKETCHVDQNKDANKAVYDSVEDNAGYHELGELSQPSNYDQLK
ncbi:scavenger receptor class F member 2-like [Saccostrea cucullata]|uniref:scavenger receptor class F member 2-like n=1 Tax=Saccostrea cuccullata TaxID=36930 RepID=UPI002ED45FB9